MAKFLCAGSGSSGNAYAIKTDSGEILLIECGVNWKKMLKMIGFDVMHVSGCVVSHSHLDHASEFEKVLQSGISIYTNDETAEHFETAYGERMIGRPEKVPFSCGTFTIIPFYVPHTSSFGTTCWNFGYIIKQPEMGKLLYMTDMEYSPHSFRSWEIEHLVIECNYVDSLVDRSQIEYLHRIQGHCSLETCKEIIRVNQTPALQTVTLIHLSDKASDEEQIFCEIQKVLGNSVEINIARPGICVELNRFPF